MGPSSPTRPSSSGSASSSAMSYDEKTAPTLTHDGKHVAVLTENKDDLESRATDNDPAGAVSDAIAAENAEKNIGFWAAIKTYHRAVLWSMAISLCLVMEGYDTALLGAAIATPAFRKKFGYYAGASKGYQLTPAWQAALGQGPTVGAFCGIFIASWAQDRWGYRRTIQAGLIAMTGFVFVVFFAPRIEIFFLGGFLCGFPWGAFSSSAVAYASEITPIKLRGYLTTYVNLCWIVGQFLSAAVVLEVTNVRQDEWAYKIPFAIQWVWPIPIFILVTLAPESPWFLVRKGRLEEAEKSVSRLSSGAERASPAETVAMMVRTNHIEQSQHESTSYLECFRGSNLRRTEITCVAWACTVWAGASFANHPEYFFTQAGMSTSQSFKITLGLRALGFLGTLGSWVLMSHFGRRQMYLFGLSADAIILLLVGILASTTHTKAAVWAQGALVMLWVFFWDLSVTVTAYAIVGEMSSTRMRAKSVGLARNLYNVCGIGAGFLNTYSINATAWNWKGKAAFLWCGTCVLALVWTYFRLPEAKGRSFRELDILFERGVPARDFKKTVIADNEEK